MQLMSAVRCACEQDVWGLQGGVKIMTMPYKKDIALCSPTSAFEKKQMLSRLGEELRNSSCG